MPEKAQLDLLAIALPPEFAEEWQAPARNAKIPAIVFDLADFLERGFVEGRFGLRVGPDLAQQAAQTVIPEQIWMYVEEAGGGIE